MLVLRHHETPARYSGWAFICLLVVFVAVMQSSPAAGLSGLGSVLVLSSLLVEANKDRIWRRYQKQYKYRKTDLLPKAWTAPNKLYYQLNVYVVWPLVFLLGMAAILTAWMIG